MTVRAVVIGLLLGLVIAAFGYLNDWPLKLAFVASDLIPVSVYGLLVLGLLLANPLLRLIRSKPLAGGEWAVIASLLLMACIVPGPALMWNFSHTIVMPHKHNQLFSGWRKAHLIEYAPPVMLVDTGENNQDFDVVVSGFDNGINAGKPIRFDQVPWHAWTRTLSFWMPLMALSFLGGLCLVLVVHHQWAHRERLRYPVADFASELLEGAGDRALPNIFYNRRFWLGFVPVVVILLINGYYAYNTKSIQIPLTTPLTAFANKWTSLQQLPFAWKLQNPTIYFAAVGFAYFVSSEVSFSIGIAPVLHSVLFLALLTRGVDMQTDVLTGGVAGWQLFGSYLGLGLIIFYTGRKFYWTILRRACFVATKEPAERMAVWACRLAILAGVGMVLILWLAVRLSIPLAVLFVMLTGLLFLLVTRINVETGLFFIQPNWHAVSVLLGMFGIAALGPNLIVVLAILSMVMTIDPRVALMPMAANALRFSEVQGIKPKRLSFSMALVLLLTMVVGVTATIYTQYTHGGGTLYGWASDAAKWPFEMLNRNLNRFPNADWNHWQGMDLSKFRPEGRFLVSAGLGVAVVLLCSVFRLRYHWWPLHPVAFLVWGTWALACTAPSFLLGWLIKAMISRFGGGKAYRSNKPLFVGMVAGELIAGLLWSIIGLIYYLNKGVAGPKLIFHP